MTIVERLKIRVGIQSTVVGFWSRTELAPNGCIEWVRGLSKGYGQYGWNGRNTRAHRIAWQLAYGPITSDQLVLHKCNNRRCVNVSHLYLGTPMDNVQDAIAAGIRYGHKPSGNCRSGHRYEESNTRFRSKRGNRYRVCLICHRAENKRWKERRLAARLGAPEGK